MSNVLIGIIGVILFIGLALAGALFLGPRFQSATHNSKASAAIQAVKQVTDAADMYRVNEGQTISITGMPDLIGKGYLKSLPRIGDSVTTIIDENGCAGCNTGRASAIGLYLGTDDAAKSICEAVSRQTGQLPSNQAYAPPSRNMTRTDQTAPSGCARVGTEYYVFSFL